MKRPVRVLAPLLGLPLLFAAGLAIASRTGDARARSEAALGTLSKTPAHAWLARESIDPAKRALRRADDARASGDYPHAALLEGLALEHAESGVDLVRAVDAEKKLAQTEKELTELETKITRARALLEETLARRGRARAKLEELEKAPKPPVVPPKGGKK